MLFGDTAGMSFFPQPKCSGLILKILIPSYIECEWYSVMGHASFVRPFIVYETVGGLCFYFIGVSTITKK